MRDSLVTLVSANLVPCYRAAQATVATDYSIRDYQSTG